MAKEQSRRARPIISELHLGRPGGQHETFAFTRWRTVPAVRTALGSNAKGKWMKFPVRDIDVFAAGFSCRKHMEFDEKVSPAVKRPRNIGPGYSIVEPVLRPEAWGPEKHQRSHDKLAARLHAYPIILTYDRGGSPEKQYRALLK